MNIKKSIFSATLLGVLFSSCSSDNEPALPKGDYENGVLVNNEGAFSGGTGTINYIAADYQTEVATIYSRENNENLGTIVQSIGFNNDDAYIVANVANKISVANRYTMAKITEITVDLENPRYIAFANGKGYVTNWGDGSDTMDDYIAVVDLSTNTVTSKISVKEGPEQIVANGTTLYVSHKGGWGVGNSVSVINANNDTFIKNIIVGSVPDEMSFDTSGNLFVSCEGSASTQWSPTEVLGALVKINTTTNEVMTKIDFVSEFHPNNMLTYEGNTYLSTSSGIYKMEETSSVIPSNKIIATQTNGFSVNDNKIYITDAKDFNVNGTLQIFDATTYQEQRKFTVGLIPSKIYFNE